MLHLDLYVYPGRQIQMHQLVDRFVGRLNDINETLMRFDHKVFPAVAVDKRTPRDIVMFAVGRQWHGSHNFGAGSHRRIQNFLAAVIYDPAVIRF